MKKLLAISFLLLFGISCGPLGEANKLYDAGDYAEAIVALKRVLAQDSTNVAAWTLLAKSYERAGQPDSAIVAYKTVLQWQSPEPQAQAALAQLYVAKANAARDDEQPRQALDYYERAAKFAPNGFDVYFERGQLYFRRKRLEKAKADLSKAGEIAPDDPRPKEMLAKIATIESEAQGYYNEGKAYYDQGKWNSAIKKLEQAVDLRADYTDAKYDLHMARGRRLYKRGSLNTLWDAITEYGKASTLKPELAEPYYYMGLAYEKKDRDDYKMPTEVYRHAIAAEPDSKFAKKSQKRIDYLLNLKEKMDKFWGRGKKKK